MKKDVMSSEKRKRGKSSRAAARLVPPKPAKTQEITDADLDQVTGGAVGPCDHTRTRNTA